MSIRSSVQQDAFRFTGLAVVGLLALGLVLFSRPQKANAQEQQTYTVQSGDTLVAIAQQFDTNVQAIVELNNIANPNLISPGQQLVIPGTGGPGDGNGDANEDGDRQTYVVQPGDWLSTIAAQFNTNVQALVELNNIADPSLIFPGQVLVIPATGGPGPGDGNGDGGTGENGNDGITRYVVRSGDTLSLIARRYGTTVEALAQVNDIANPGLIFPGQVLVIPGTGGPGDGAGNGDGDASTYIVQSGDTLSLIAQRFGTTVSALVEANDIATPNLIFPGRVLTIPS